MAGNRGIIIKRVERELPAAQRLAALNLMIFCWAWEVKFNLAEKCAASHYRQEIFALLHLFYYALPLNCSAPKRTNPFSKKLNKQIQTNTKAHLMDKIKAKHLATGDRVRFSRNGWQTVGRLTSSNSLSVAFMFADGIIRKLEAHREYVVEEGNQPPEPQPGQIMRLNKESNRISVCASHSLFDLSDISESFRAIKQRDSQSNSAAAYHALEKGATLYTHDAVYWMPLKWSGEATKGK